jgi:hypothetical protein
MKKLFILSAMLLLGAYSCSTQLNTDKEKEAIKAVIEEEKDAYFARDWARMGESWVQDSNSRKFAFYPTGLTYLSNWSEVDADHKRSAES